MIKIILAILILVAAILTAIIIIENLDATPAVETQASFPVNVFASQTTIKSEFDQIHRLDYDVESMNCKHKSELFAEYLASINASDIKIMTIARTDGEGGHEIVLWNNRVYDPTSGIYNASKNDYIEMIRGKGFDGIIVTIPYQGGIKDAL